MQPYEKQKLLTDLQNGRDIFLHTVSGVTEELATRVPAPGTWSVLQCVEHVVVSEDYMFSQIQASYQAETPAINPEREARIVAVGRDRNRKIQAPKEGQPNGRFSTLAKAVQHFQASRAKTIEFVENCNDDLRCTLTSHPIIGTVNCYEMLLMIAAHPFRHAEQIEEIKSGYRQPATGYKNARFLLLAVSFLALVAFESTSHQRNRGFERLLAVLGCPASVQSSRTAMIFLCRVHQPQPRAAAPLRCSYDAWEVTDWASGNFFVC